MLDLLPHNATDQERALDLTTARIRDIADPQADGAGRDRIRNLWSADNCAPDLLPWLAWALSVDAWDPEWSENQKRETVRRAIEVQRIKGTIGAVRRGLGAIGIEALVLEWHRQETPGTPYTYQIFFDANSNAETIADILDAIGTVENLKSLRSHMEFAQVAVSSTADVTVAAAVSVGSEIVVSRYVAPPISLAGIWDDSLTWNDAQSWGLEL